MFMMFECIEFGSKKHWKREKMWCLPKEIMYEAYIYLYGNVKEVKPIVG